MDAGCSPVRPRGARRPAGCSEAGVGTRAASCCAPRWPVESRSGQEGARRAGRAAVSCRPVGGFSHPRRRPCAAQARLRAASQDAQRPCRAFRSPGRAAAPAVRLPAAP